MPRGSNVRDAMTEPCPEPFVALAERLAEAARAIIRPLFRSRIAVDEKPDSSPVTIADRDSEAAMRRVIDASFPEHGVIGEEHGHDRSDARYVWVLDPVDGTKRFITANPLFGTLIGLLRDGQPILGIIDMPMLDERWIGAAGRPTQRVSAKGMETAGVRACGALAQATLMASSPHMFGPDLPAFERLRQAVKTPLYGGDCYNYGLLADGFTDLVVEADMGPYDFLPLVPVVEGAGGVMTDWAGRPLRAASDGRCVAAGDTGLHQAALALLMAH